MPLRKEPNAIPIPGYRLIELLGRGGCGEVWKCEAPGGLFKAIKFVYGSLHGLDSDRTAADEELRSIEHIKAIRHPFLLSMDRVECIQGELVIVTELADNSLHQLLEQYRRQGHDGLPRELLLGYLREAAEVLDLLNFQYGLQHLDVKPRNLFLVHNHIKVADFGLVNRLAAAGDGSLPVQLGAITPLYAAPEIFHGTISPHADQYSLAATYQELLTGSLPFEGENSRQLLLQHTSAEPDLRKLPPADRLIVARALAKESNQRFASCTEFVQRLTEAPGLARGESVTLPPNTAAASADQASAAQTPPRSRPDADTDVNLKGLTERARPQHLGAERFARESLPAGYRLGKCLDNTPVQERWQVEAPDGRKRVLRILYGSHSLDAERFQEALLRLRTLQHPGLIRLEVLPSVPGRIVLLTDLVEQSLRDYHLRCQSRRLPGIPRADLLSFLLTAAETLDYLYRQHSIQHLSLSPRNLLLDHGRLLVDEFGVAQLVWQPSGQLAAQPNKRYAAPELVAGRKSTSCDQYSLALIYVELLTSRLSRGSQIGAGTPIALTELPPDDMAIVARALDPDPAKRWPSSLEFVRALEKGHFTTTLSEQAGHDDFAALVKGAAPGSRTGHKADAEAVSALEQLIANLIRSAGGEVNLAAQEQAPELCDDGQLLRHKFVAGLPLGEARLKLDAVREQLYGQLIDDEIHHYRFHVSMPSNFWGKWTGRQPGLEVDVHLARQHALAPTPIEVRVEIRTFHCGRKRGKELLQDVGLPALEQVRAALLVNSEKRIQERLLWPHPVQITPILEDGSRSDTVICRGKDISLSGAGLYLPHPLETSEVVINLPATAQGEAISIPATLVRARPCADGWYEVGALFRLTTFRNSHAELNLAHA